MNIWRRIIVFFTVFLIVGLTSSTSLGNSEYDEAEISDIDTEYPVMTGFPPATESMLEKMNPDPKPAIDFNDLPSQFSWTDYGGNWMTSVKEQGYKDCWCFSAIGGMEAAINIASGSPNTDIDLSEQYVESCLSAAGSYSSGGLMSLAIEYIESSNPGSTGNGINGCTIESCMPYQNMEGVPCSDKCDDWDMYSEPPQYDDKLYQILDYTVTTTSEDNPGDWYLLKSWIMAYGPLIIDIYTGGWKSFWTSHHDPNDVYEQDDYGTTNHGVVLVGWVDDSSILNGGYWIIKNSWGTDWGYGGYANIAYGCNGVATREAIWVLTPPWPEGGGNGGPVDVDAAVFSNFEYETEDHTQYPHVGDEIEFTDISDGDVSSRKWDFNGDGKVDSTKKRPTWSFDREGEYEVTLSVRSEWGIESNRTRVVGVKEVWPPVAEITPGSYADNEVEVGFDGRYSHDVDGGRIVSYLWDFDDGSTSNELNPVHTFPEPDRKYNVTLTVTDDDGASSSSVCVVAIDQTVPPVTRILHGFGDDGTDWYRSTERVSFIAEDWTEVVSTHYRVDDGSWNRYIPEEQRYIPVSGEGMHTVECYSVDYYGNEESVVSESFGIDLTPPVVDVSVSGEMENGWYVDEAFVSVSASDALSGVSEVLYKVDGGSWKEASSDFVLDAGRHYVSILAVDEAGNTVEDFLEVKVDGGSPESRVIFDGEGSNSVFYESVSVRLVASDPGAGVLDVFYRLDGADFVVYDTMVVVDEVGEHLIEFYAVDVLGNEEQIQQVSFEVSPVNFVAELVQPGDALYVFGVELFSLNSPVIIGGLDLVVDVESFTGSVADVGYVEFLVDGDVQMSDAEAPFVWRLDESLVGSHEIGVNVVSNGETVYTESVDAMCFIF